MVAAPQHGRLKLGNIRDEVYRILHERILTHEYPPGFRFDLSQLENQLGVSRTPLKEALHRLQAEGLIEIRPRRGTYVIKLDPHDVAESFDVRRILECAAAEIAATAASEAELGQLGSIAAEMSRLLVSAEYQRIVAGYIALDRQFHRYIVGLAHNKRLIEMWHQLDTHVQIARVRRQFDRSDSLKYTETEHEAILQAFTRRDPPALVKALAEHIEISKIRTLKAIETDE